jgi:hypothetical protein
VVGLNSSTYRYSATDPSWSLVKPAKKTEPYTFTYLLDATKFTDATTQVTLNIDAKDVAGNGAVTRSLLLNIDNQPPLVSLDPPNVRVLTHSDPDLYCSKPFDPLGDLAANDKDPVFLNALFRALIWEQTNRTASTDLEVFAGVDPLTPHLYLQSDPTKPVIIDTNNDGICDAINPELKASTRSIALDPIPPFGGGDTNAPVDLKADPSVENLDCSPQSVDLKKLCADHSSDMDTVIGQHVTVGDEPTDLAAVWGVQVGSSTSLTCTGRRWELSKSFANEGWQCLAASASDTVGNEGISPPLRVCLDDETTTFQPTCDPSQAPTCTDGCTPPSRVKLPRTVKR